MRGPIDSFRMLFWTFLGWVLLISISIGVPLGLLTAFLLFGTLLPPVTLLLVIVTAVAGGEVVAVLAVALFVAFLKVHVGPDGLRACNAWGLYRTVAWADMLSARPVNMMGMRFLRVHTTGALLPLSVPLFLHDFERFCSLVRQYAGPDHLLARALHEELTG
jgi:hypothetical protein